MSIFVDLSLADPQVRPVGAAYASAASIANMFQCTIVVTIGEQQFHGNVPLAIFFGEFAQTITESMLLGITANFYMDSTPVAWVLYDNQEFEFKYYVGINRRSVRVSEEAVLNEMKKISLLVNRIYREYTNIKEVIGTLSLYRSFGSDLLVSLLSYD